mgnify:FL=1
MFSYAKDMLRKLDLCCAPCASTFKYLVSFCLQKDLQDQHVSKTTPPSSPGVTAVSQSAAMLSTITTIPSVTSTNNTKIIAQSQTNSTSLLNNVNNVATATQGGNHMVDSGKASFAISALVNGQTVRGNGIKHLNGPSTKGW